jgi:hypothetical protein
MFADDARAQMPISSFLDFGSECRAMIYSAVPIARVFGTALTVSGSTVLLAGRLIFS